MKKGEVWYKKEFIDEKWGKNKPPSVFIIGDYHVNLKTTTHGYKGWRLDLNRMPDKDATFKDYLFWEAAYFESSSIQFFEKKNIKLSDNCDFTSNIVAKLLLTEELDYDVFEVIKVQAEKVGL